MNLLTVLQPFINLGSSHSSILNWLITLIILAISVCFIVWLVTKFAGPPNIPEPFRWIIWLIVGVVLLVIICAAFGVSL